MRKVCKAVVSLHIFIKQVILILIVLSGVKNSFLLSDNFFLVLVDKLLIKSETALESFHIFKS